MAQSYVADSISAPIVRGGNYLYAGSKDTNLYKINIITGTLVWKLHTGASLVDAPRVTKTMVYQYAYDKGFYGINSKSGQVVWLLEEGVDLLGESDGKAYVMTSQGHGDVMDNKTGERLYSINFSEVVKHASDAANSIMYLADLDGKVACVKPLK